MTCVSSRAPLLAFKLKEVGGLVLLAPLRGSVGLSRRGSQPSSHRRPFRIILAVRGQRSICSRHISPRPNAKSRMVAAHRCPSTSSTAADGVRTGVSGAQARPTKNAVASSDASMKMIRPSFSIFHSAGVSTDEWIQQDWQAFHGNRRSSDPRHHRDLVRHRAVPWCRLRSMCA